MTAASVPAPEIGIRPLLTTADALTASAVLSDVWHGDPSGMPPNLLRALAHSGNYAAGLYADGRMVGASVAFFAAPAERTSASGRSNGASAASRGPSTRSSHATPTST